MVKRILLWPAWVVYVVVGVLLLFPWMIGTTLVGLTEAVIERMKSGMQWLGAEFASEDDGEPNTCIGGPPSEDDHEARITTLEHQVAALAKGERG